VCTGSGSILGGFSVDVGVDMGMIVGDEDGSDVGTGTGTLLGGFSVDVGVDMGMIVGDEDGSDVGNREGVADGRGVGVMYSFLSSP
jgi:hypothetical protein